jgi:hypothetical protein
MSNPIPVQPHPTTEICSCCETYPACPLDKKSPRCCSDYVWDGSYTPEEEADMEDY